MAPRVLLSGGSVYFYITVSFIVIKSPLLKYHIFRRSLLLLTTFS